MNAVCNEHGFGMIFLNSYLQVVWVCILRRVLTRGFGMGFCGAFEPSFFIAL